MEDFTTVMRDIEAIQSELDKIFKRENTGPVFITEKQLRDAVSDNARFFAEDRKKDFAEIIYAITDVIYDRIAKQEKNDPFCNPQVPVSEAKTPRLPEFDMFRRIIMPLSWAMEERWPEPKFAKTIDGYMEIFTPEEVHILRQGIEFIVDLFPEFKDSITLDMLDYWKMLDTDRGNMRPETNEEKSWLLDRLMQKHAAYKQRREQKN